MPPYKIGHDLWSEIEVKTLQQESHNISVVITSA